jgi:hypothetical protein
VRARFVGFRWIGLLASLFVGCGRAAASTPVPENETRTPGATGFAVVELFTSEGCSSCPPADDVFRDLASEAKRTGSRVYALAFHVDYWNSLGWPDPYSSASSTDRQRAYARALRQQGVYTPEMIVNGREGFVGSDASRARRLVEASRRGPAGTAVELRPMLIERRPSVDFSVADPPAGSVLQLALVQVAAESHVAAGENEGKTLRHAHVVRALRTIDLDRNRSGRATFPKVADRAGSVAVVGFVQNPESMAVWGAAQASFEETHREL